MITVEEVKQLRANYMIAQNNDDVEGCLSFWADDGAIMNPNEPIIQGKEALRDMYNELFSQVLHDVTIYFDEIGVSETWSFAQGHYDGRMIPKDDSDPFSVKGKYVEIHKRQPDGSLKFYRHMWSTDLP